jgi:hypothetical protein
LYGKIPQGSLSGSTIDAGLKGQLIYTSSNGGGPFIIVLKLPDGSTETVSNVRSGIAFELFYLPKTTTTYTLISVNDVNYVKYINDEIISSTATITVNFPTHYIGESFGGGIVFYLDESRTHGLISATSDQSTVSGIEWWNGSYNYITQRGTAVGKGLINTNAIISAQGNTGNYAAKIAKDYRGGGFSDWYLPSKDELFLMYSNIGQGAAPPNNNIGGFANGGAVYYSSSPYYNDIDHAWVLNFLGTFTYGDTSDKQHVRAIRSF